MANNSFDLSVIISAVDRFTAPVRRMSNQLDRLTSPIRRVGASFRNLGEAAGIGRLAGSVGTLNQRVAGLSQTVVQTAGSFALLAGGAAFAFNSLFIQPAAQFERFQSILETVEGSSRKAQESMDWVSDFAASTPYELDQVMDAFVRLRARGFDPTNGLLETLGDTAAAMGKDINDAVEAIADAVTGENERLKEFGITARTEGDKVTYAYTVAGKQMTASVNKNNREMIQKTLAMIWNEQYGGAMDKMSTTWIGMMSNLSDQWTRFVTMVMGSGAFDWLKNELEGLLDLVNQMAEDGRLQAWAQKLSDAFVTAFEGIKTAIPVVVDGLREFADAVIWFVDLVGGWKNALIGVAAFLAAPFIASLVSVGQALVQLGWVLMTTPVGWFLAAVAAIAGAAYLIYRNWDGITDWWSGLWKDVTDAFDQGFIQGIWKALLTFNPLNLIMQAINDIIVWMEGPDLLSKFDAAGMGIVNAIKAGITSGWDSLTSWFRSKIDGLLSYLPDWMRPGSSEPPPGSMLPPSTASGANELVGPPGSGAVGLARGQAATATGQSLRSESRVKVDFENAPQGTKVTTESDGRTEVDTTMGYSMIMP